LRWQFLLLSTVFAGDTFTNLDVDENGERIVEEFAKYEVE